MKKYILALCLVLLATQLAYAGQFRPPMPSAFTNSSPERFYDAGNCTVRSFTNTEIFSCYVHVIRSEGGNILIDPGYYDDELKDYLKSIGGVDVILLSHCHVDHIIGLDALKRDYPEAKIYIGASDLEGLRNININYSFEREISEPFVIESEAFPVYPGTYNFAGHSVRVIPAAGHSPGSTLYYFEDAELLFIGDTIAFGGIPRHDGSNANIPGIFETFIRIKNLGLSDKAEIFFGHGEHMKYIDMLRTYKIYNNTPELSVKVQDGENHPVNDYYFDGDTIYISLEEIIGVAGMVYFGSPDGAVAYLPQFGRLRVRAGSSEAEFNTFPVNMNAVAQVKDGKIYLPGRFVSEVFKPFMKWDLKSK